MTTFLVLLSAYVVGGIFWVTHWDIERDIAKYHYNKNGKFQSRMILLTIVWPVVLAVSVAFQVGRWLADVFKDAFGKG